MNFVIPMAGHGQRFKDAGYDKPKMLIEAKGKTLLEWSIDSLPLDLCNRLIFIGLQEHDRDYNISSFIRNKYEKHCEVIQIYLPEVTRGQSETVLAAKKYINPKEALLIYNIDTTFKSKNLKANLQKPNVSVLGSFQSCKDNFSYAKKKSDGYVTEVKEKEVISEHALTGLYHFESASDFLQAAEESIVNNERTKNEFYVAPLYNKLIKAGRKIILDPVDEFHILGTPEELEDFIND